MQIHPTRTGSDGTGYYRGADGNMYYGNPANGYLTETRESAQRHAAPERKPNPGPSVQFDTGIRAPGPIEKAITAGGIWLLVLVFAAAIVWAIGFGALDSWRELFAKFLDCLGKEGLFTTLRLFWHPWAYLLAALFCLKKLFRTRSIPWTSLAGTYAVIALLREWQNGPEGGLSAVIWNGAVNALIMALPVAVLLWALHRLLRRLGFAS